jgi:type VI secretion system protein ImpC
MFPTDTDFESQVSLETQAISMPEDPPFHILFLSDYSGRENSSKNGENSSPDYQIFEIDRDNFDDVMQKLNTSLRLDLRGIGRNALILNFSELDDFHPDRIFQRISLFSDLRDVRKRLLKSDTFETAAREVRSWFEDSSEVEQSNADISENIISDISAGSGNLLDDILSDTKAEAVTYRSQPTESVELNSFIRDIVQPHIIQTDEQEQERLVALVDETTSELMRKILHHPQFQALESAWRGLYFVVRRTDTNNDLKLFLMDISKEEISDNLKSSKDLTDSDIFRKIVIEKNKSFGGEPWALICGNYEFELNVEDVAALIRLGKIANISNAPFISHVKPEMLGIESLVDKPNVSDWNLSETTDASKLWTMLRTISVASSIGLAIPKFLARLPYGELTDPTEVFSFEEVTKDFQHKYYLWSNPSFAIALLLAQSFRSFGWEIGRKLLTEIDGLPTHLYSQDGENKTKSCAEINMTHTACDTLIEQGLIPLISFRDTDIIKIADFQSIAFPSKSLNSRWG